MRSLPTAVTLGLLLAGAGLFAPPAVAAEDLPVAITFDDLPAAGSAPLKESRLEVAKSAIATLKHHRLSEVYGFVNGILVENMPERHQILQSWKDAGFLLGNHTFAHSDLGQVTPEEFIHDLEKNEPFLVDFASSIAELKWFRYPFLHEGDTVEKRYAIRSYLAKRRYRIAPVSVDFDDWALGEPYLRCAAQETYRHQLEELEEAFLRHAVSRLRFSVELAKRIYGPQRRFKHVLLVHLTPFTVRMLDRLLNAYGGEGVHWITFSEASTEPAYEEDTVAVGPVGKTFLVQAMESRKLSYPDLPVTGTPKAWLESVCR